MDTVATQGTSWEALADSLASQLARIPNAPGYSVTEETQKTRDALLAAAWCAHLGTVPCPVDHAEALRRSEQAGDALRQIALYVDRADRASKPVILSTRVTHENKTTFALGGCALSQGQLQQLTDPKGSGGTLAQQKNLPGLFQELGDALGLPLEKGTAFARAVFGPSEPVYVTVSVVPPNPSVK